MSVPQGSSRDSQNSPQSTSTVQDIEANCIHKRDGSAYAVLQIKPSPNPIAEGTGLVAVAFIHLFRTAPGWLLGSFQVYQIVVITPF